jgi:hypothetical protein
MRLRSPDLKFELLEHKVKINKVLMKVKSYGDAYAILSYTAYPTIKVYINDKETDYFETLYGMIVVKLQPGINSIQIIPTRTKLAKLFFYLPLSLFLLIIGIFIFYFYKKKNPRILE